MLGRLGVGVGRPGPQRAVDPELLRPRHDLVEPSLLGGGVLAGAALAELAAQLGVDAAVEGGDLRRRVAADAGADGMGLEDGHPQARAGQHERRGQAGDPGADDAHVGGFAALQRRAHGRGRRVGPQRGGLAGQVVHGVVLTRILVRCPARSPSSS